MKFVIITLFPEMFELVLGGSIIGRAQETGAVEIEYVNLRDFGIGPRKQVDDTPYGGGAGMVLKVDVVAAAIEEAKARITNKGSRILLMTPQGDKLVQSKVKSMAEFDGDYIVVCGHYEGYDERIRNLVDMEISIGDYVLTGGEIPAMVLVDSITRLLPGVLGKEASHEDESHSEPGRVEYPHYTRPEEWNGHRVPAVLLSGNHAEIEKWRRGESTRKSAK